MLYKTLEISIHSYYHISSRKSLGKFTIGVIYQMFSTLCQGGIKASATIATEEKKQAKFLIGDLGISEGHQTLALFDFLRFVPSQTTLWV